MTIILDYVSKVYNGQDIIKDFYLSIEDKRIYQIVGPKAPERVRYLRSFWAR